MTIVEWSHNEGVNQKYKCNELRYSFSKLALSYEILRRNSVMKETPCYGSEYAEFIQRSCRKILRSFVHFLHFNSRQVFATLLPGIVVCCGGICIWIEGQFEVPGKFSSRWRSQVCILRDHWQLTRINNDKKRAGKLKQENCKDKKAALYSNCKTKCEVKTVLNITTT